MAVKSVKDESIKSVADAIRAKGGTSTQLTFPNDFVQAIKDIPTGGGAKPEQSKAVTYTSNGNYTVAPDNGKVLNKVSVKVNVAGSCEPTGNCEAYVTDVTAPKANFTIITSGPIKVWGGGVKGSGWSVKTYAFYGDKSVNGSTVEQLNLRIDASGNIIGLPALDSGTVLVTRGV